MTQQRQHSQVLVIGAGISGSTTALTLADAGYEVTLIVPGKELDGGNSALAQGGIVYRPNPDDAKALEKDILIAGHHHNYVKAVRQLCQNGPEAVERLLMERTHIPFNHTEDGTDKLDFTREGGHSTPRILHCADHSGRSIMDGLLAEVHKTPNIQVLTGRTAVDLITTHHHARQKEYRYQLENQCLGAYVYNDHSRQVETLLADWTVLATGGVGQVYLHTTNTPSSTGSGIAMAQRAGVRLDNMEYIQFHPTALYTRLSHRFLITEALRGEGARLVNSRGDAFMTRYDERADLAPRDIVARAIMDEMLHSGDDCVYLNLSNVKHDIPHRFPTIYEHCMKLGIDVTREPIPVVPVAHYFCGGILTDTQGRTTLSRLYSVGECSCTGLHGANRLASTSLLEALLWGYSAGKDIAKRITRNSLLSDRLGGAIPDWQSTGNEQNDDPALIAQDWANIRNTMWNYVGISRTSSRLHRAFEDLRDLSRHLHDFYRNTALSKPIIDLFHGCQTAYIITQSALRNPVSLGCHHRVD
ncbi:MAG: L-aspartate oxidase [Bilophila sp.]